MLNDWWKAHRLEVYSAVVFWAVFLVVILAYWIHCIFRKEKK